MDERVQLFTIIFKGENLKSTITVPEHFTSNEPIDRDIMKERILSGLIIKF